ncbi:MAG: ABC transporter substrate-binding protein [Actinobacteria bacterium]|nr:ABC transporter substrate-binding protein [Actinomycetota bacterium]
MYRLFRGSRALTFAVIVALALSALVGCSSQQQGQQPAPAKPDEKAPQQAVQPAGGETSAKSLATGSKYYDIIKRDKIRVGWAPWAPMVYLDPKTKQITGASVDVVHALAEALGVDIEWVETTWGTMVTGLQGDLYDITIPIGRTVGRAKQAEFSQGIWYGYFTLAVKKDSPYQKWQDLDKAGKKISVTQGSNTDEVLSKVAKNAEIVRVKQTSEAVLELQTDRVDAMATLGPYFSGHAKEWPDLRILDDKFGDALEGIAAPQGDQILVNVINQFISDWKANGGPDRIIQKWELNGYKACPIYY